MVSSNIDTKRRGELPGNASADKVRKIIEEACKSAGTSVAIEERMDGAEDGQSSPRRRLHVTYNGDKPLPYPTWFKLVDQIDEALDASDLIDWESSELSEETDDERMAAWAIAPSASA